MTGIAEPSLFFSMGKKTSPIKNMIQENAEGNYIQEG
jgi:hypothetical protein